MLPNANQAFVEEKKLLDYFLSVHHPQGADKAGYLASIGFDLTAPESVAAALLAHGRANPALLKADNQFGLKYYVDGPIFAPDGRSGNLRTVWVIDPGQTSPRLVTIEPLAKIDIKG